MPELRRVCLASLLVLASGLTFAGVAQAGTITVSTTADPAGAGSCPGSPCSLRQAVNAASDGDTIQLLGSSATPAVYQLTQGSQIVVGKSLTIQGGGVGGTTVDGSQNIDTAPMFPTAVRMLKVTAGTLHVAGVTFTGGADGEDEAFVSCSPCLTLNGNGGGALYNQGATVMLQGVVFDSNTASATPVGGAVSNDGTLDMKDVSFTNNNGAGFGGALFGRGGTITADGVTFDSDGGSGTTGGGAVYLYTSGTATFVNTTVVNSGTPSSRGGGLDNDGSTLTLKNDTFSGNIRGSLERDAGTTTIQNTIIGSGFDDNGADFDCVTANQPNGNGVSATPITADLGNNIDQDDACGLNGPDDQAGVDPKLVAIGDNGGPTRTQALEDGSPAIDAANDSGCPGTDQRHIARTHGTHCDIGAFEVVPNRTLTTTVAGAGAVTGSGIDCPGSCSHAYAEGTAVALTATPAEGSTFSGWSGACGGTGACSVTMSADQAVTATFATPEPPTPTTPTTPPTPTTPTTPPPHKCSDKAAPVTTLKRSGVKGVGGARLSLRGTSRDASTCSSGLRKVQVSLARVSGRTGTNCRFIKHPDRYALTHPQNCRRPILFTARGTRRWTFSFPVRLKRGDYRVQARATDKAGNKETPRQRRNIVLFSVG